MAATAEARTAAPAPRTPTRRAPARRPARKPAASARPATRRRRQQTPIVGFVPVAAARTAGAVGGLADSGIVVRLTRGRLWIGTLATLLVGIVGLNVMALSFNSSSSDAGRAAEALQRQNSTLRAQLADRLSTEEVQAAARDVGLVFAEPGAIGYLKPSPDDAAEAARRLRDGELAASEYSAPVTDPAALTGVAPTETVPTEVVAPETVAPTEAVAPTETVAPTQTVAPTEAAAPAVDPAAGAGAVSETTGGGVSP